MDDIFDVNYYREMNPHLPKFMDARLTRYYKENPKEGVICNDYTFRKKYPEFDINYAVLFNNDIYNNLTSFEVKCDYHINKKRDGRIYSYSDFINLYPEFTGKDIVDSLEFWKSKRVTTGLEGIAYPVLHKFINIPFSQFRNYSNMNSDELIENLSKRVPYHRINIVYKNNYNFDYLYPDDVINRIENHHMREEVFIKYQKYNVEKGIQPFTHFYNLRNHELYYYWIEKMINEKCMTIKSPKTGKLISTNKYFILSYPVDNTEFLYSIANYYFIDENIVVGIGLGTGSSLAGMQTRVLYIYNHEDFTLHYSYDSYDVDKFKIEKLPIIIKSMMAMNIMEDLNNNQPEIVTWYGYHNNMGHNLFNDITGLYILDKTGLINKIDKIYIGENDPFYFHEYFKTLKDVGEITERKTIVNGEIIYGCGIVFKYNHYFISNDCVEFMGKFWEKSLVANRNIKKIRNEVDIIRNRYERYPIINIVLRAGHSIIENQVEFYTELINKILAIYPNAFFFFDGFCSNPYIDSNTILQQHGGRNISCADFIKDYTDVYNQIVNNVWIKSGFDKDFCEVRYKSLIGLYSNEIQEYLKGTDYAIYHIGSGCTISGWLCNIPGYQFGRINTHMYKRCDEHVREEMCEIVYNSDIKIETDEIIRCLREKLMSK